MVRAAPLVLASLALLAPSAAAKPKPHPGQLDRSFADNGRLVVPGALEVVRLDSTPDNRIIVAVGPGVREFLPNGKPNRTFGVNGVLEPAATGGMSFSLAGIAVDSEGRLLIAGTTRSPEASPGPPNFPGPSAAWAAVYRFLPNGQPDLSFGSAGVTLTTFDQKPPTGPGPGIYGYERLGEFPYTTASVAVSGLAVDAEDRPVVTGTSTSRVTPGCYLPPLSGVGYQSRTYVGRLTTTGQPDPSFGSGGAATDESYENPGNPAVGSDGRIVYTNAIADRCPRGSEWVPSAITTLGADGVALNRFFVGSPSARREVNVEATAIDGRNRVLTLSRLPFSEGTEAAWTRVERRLPNGALDKTFGRGGIANLGLSESSALAIAVDGRNRILIAGRAEIGKGKVRRFCFGLARLNADGKKDLGFGRSGKTKTSFPPRTEASVSAMAIDDKGRIILGGIANRALQTDNALALARYVDGG
jgi:uncharacterized delta-60 repeat protein